MPYLRSEARGALDGGACPPTNAAQLNYQITAYVIRADCPSPFVVYNLMQAYVSDVWAQLNYAAINDVMGAAICCAYELERRGGDNAAEVVYDAIDGWYTQVAAPYEQAAIERNGDIH